MLRIAVAGLHTECSTYNPVLAREADFKVLRGPAMLKDAYFDFLTHFPAEFITVLHARAIAGGPVEQALYLRWKAEILEGIKAALPLDGVYLAMHGAMFVEGMHDAEGDFIAAVRELVGPDVLIAASYDLHGNVSQKIVDSLDMFSTYRTAPHIDVPDTMRRAVTMLVRALRTGQRPVVGWVPVPVLLPGERTSTQDEPARTFYTQLHAVEDPEYMANILWTQVLGAMHLARIRVGLRQVAPGIPDLFTVPPEQVARTCVESALATVGAR